MEESSHDKGIEKLAGATAELYTAVELLKHGFGVSWPFGDSEGYDLIADSRACLNRVQVKSSSIKTKHGVYRVLFARGGKKMPYTKNDADYFVVVLMYSNGPAFYIIPVEEVKVTARFWEPGAHPLQAAKWHVCPYESFRDRWDLLR